MLSEFTGEQEQLPWQPNLGKNKPKLHWFQLLTRYRELFRVNNSLRPILVGEFKYAIQIFKGGKGVATATKFRPKKQKYSYFTSVQDIEKFCHMNSSVAVRFVLTAVSVHRLNCNTRGIARRRLFYPSSFILLSQVLTFSVPELEHTFLSLTSVYIRLRFSLQATPKPHMTRHATITSNRYLLTRVQCTSTSSKR